MRRDPVREFDRLRAEAATGPGRKLRRWAELARIFADYLDEAADVFDRFDFDLSRFVAREGRTGPAPAARSNDN